MRKVEYKTKKRHLGIDGKYSWQEDWGIGYFHAWGVCYEEFETGPGNYSVAIVEMEDGSVRNFYPYEITFIKGQDDA